MTASIPRLVGRLAAALLLALCLVGGATAAEPVKVKTRAGVHPGYGRIVFDWPKLPGHEATLADGRLTVRFDMPFTADYGSIKRQLDRYVKTVEPGADGRSVAFTLLKPVRLRAAVIDGVYAVDLVDKPAAAAAKDAAPAQRVEVRAGAHAGYSRLAIDWSRNVDYSVTRDGKDAITVHFKRPADLDIASIKQNTPPFLEALATAGDDGGSTLKLSTEPGVRFRHFRSGTRIVVDLLPPVVQHQPTAVHPGEEEKPKLPADTADAANAGGAADAGRPRNLLPASASKTAEGKTAAAAPEPKVDVPGARATAGPGDQLRLPASGGLNASLEHEGNAVTLRFDWGQPVAAAAFRRAGYVWLVFDREAKIDLDPISGDSGIVLAQQVRGQDATILRLRPQAGLYPAMRRNGATWMLRLSHEAQPVENDLLSVVQELDGGGDRVFIPAIDTGARVTVYDPEVGEELLVVPLLGSGSGVGAPQCFVDFQVLASAQGVVIRPNLEDLSVRPLRDGVEILASHGLAVSTPEERAAAGNDAGQVSYKASLKRPILHFKEWRGGDKAGFTARKQELQRLLARAPRAGRNVARLALAKFYLASDMAPEAAALLSMIADDDASMAQDPTFLAMRGVAELLLHHTTAAAGDLLDPKLKLYPDVALWRGLLLERQGKYAEASRQFGLGQGWLPSLAESFQRKLGLSWARAAARDGTEGDFTAAAERLEKLPPGRDIAGTLAYLRGLRAEGQQQDDEAIKQYQAAEQSMYRPMRARAALRRIDLELKLGRIDNKQAIERMKALEFAWRGDDFELRLLSRIAEVELQEKLYGDALTLMRTAVANFPESEQTRTLAKRMQETFRALFLDGKADDMEPVKALALYYEFQELTPLGDDGDRMIQKLADRLAAVDLLQPAAKLLEHQVRYRLKGLDKARVGTRLAVIDLLDTRPADALAALDKTGMPGLPAELALQRRHLRARALTEVGKSTAALALLDGDSSRGAERLRAEIPWRGQDWAAAAKATETLLGARWRQPVALDDAEQIQVVQLAVSLYMAGDPAGLQRIRSEYAGKMGKGPMADTFSMLTHQVDPSSTNFRQLAGEIARTAELESFMAGYRDRVKRDGLSAIN
ncbi:MAG TPA: tetratricopeptide repeat protein [Alphaproteobacteria bacterium]|nr:tetratricopeptide repeat protein [Alphaproteobacteria bacterium]